MRSLHFRYGPHNGWFRLKQCPKDKENMIDKGQTVALVSNDSSMGVAQCCPLDMHLDSAFRLLLYVLQSLMSPIFKTTFKGM